MFHKSCDMTHVRPASCPTTFMIIHSWSEAIADYKRCWWQILEIVYVGDTKASDIFDVKRILYNNSVTNILKQSPSSSNHCGRFWYLIFEKISPLNLYLWFCQLRWIFKEILIKKNSILQCIAYLYLLPCQLQVLMHLSSHAISSVHFHFQRSEGHS